MISSTLLVLVLLILVPQRCTQQGLYGPDENHTYKDDEVKDLPGLLPTNPGFKHYSGYLRASAKRRYFYWFVESQNDPAGDPLVLWLNGGPGCSSVNGLLTENGPFRVSTDGEFVTLAPHSWNKIANMLYLESPAGVGFSYATDNNYTTDDDQVAGDNYRALKNFFQLFSHFSSNPFYVTGESYAGIYIPTLLLLLKDDPDINVQGIAIGNGYMAPTLFANTRMPYLYYHGFISDGDWKDLTQFCCEEDVMECQFVPFQSTECQRKVSGILAETLAIPINLNNVYDICAGDGDTNLVRQHFIRTAIAFHITQLSTDYNNPQASLESEKLYSQAALQSKCTDSSKERKYLNHSNVRKALHIPDHVTRWTECSPLISETEPPYSYTRLYNDMRPQLIQILQTMETTVLIYNGDGDILCDILGAQLFVDSLNLKEVQSHKPWFYQDLDGSHQIGGFTRQFQGLTYLTVKGAGHMVPTDQPMAALEMFRKFLFSEPF